MRILHATDTYGPTVGGIEMLVQTLAQSQAAAGHEVTVVTRTPGPRSSSRSGVLVRRDANAFRSLVTGADVVHGHVSAYSPLALRTAEAAARQGIPAMATVHSVWGSAWPLFRAAAAVRGWTDLPIQWAAVSEVAAGPVRRALPGSDVLIVPNAVDTAYWAPRGLAPSTDRVTVVAVMRMARRKRPLQLLDVLARARALLPAHVAVDVVLVGDGPLRDAVRRRIAALGMTAWVHTPGDLPHDALRTLYQQADIFVAPATHESFGLAALEARAAGLAILARDHTGVTEFVQDGIDGLLADSDDEMSRHLAQLCLDPNRLRQMLSHNHLVRPVHDWTHVGELNTAAYRRAGAAAGALVSETSGPEVRPAPPPTHHDSWLLESAHTLAQGSAA